MVRRREWVPKNLGSSPMLAIHWETSRPPRHTTVMHAVKKVEELCSIDASFAEDIDLLRRMLES